jgi:hypothetical protein
VAETDQLRKAISHLDDRLAVLTASEKDVDEQMARLHRERSMATVQTFDPRRLEDDHARLRTQLERSVPRSRR